MASKGTYQAPKGTEDLYGQSAQAWELLQQVAASVFTRSGYRPLYTPVFEATELFSRGIGTATDVVTKEMYVFKDRAGRKLTLRPENTAGVVRAAIEKNLLGEGGSVKLYYAGPMFRYERPQKGRQRQFYQLGAEALGVTLPEADAEMILMLWEYFCELTLPQQHMQLLVNSMGCPQCRPAYRKELASYLRTHKDGLCDDCQERTRTNPLRTFDCKRPSCRKVLADAPKLIDALCPDCADHQAAVERLLDASGLIYRIDSTLVRGLDYYTRTVFEVQVDDGMGAQNALGGGGRYDGLFEELGGKPTPSVGFAIGFERVLLALEAAHIVRPLGPGAQVYVAVTEDALRAEAFALTSELREAGVITLCDLQGKSLKAQFKAADRAEVQLTLIVGTDELSDGFVRVRDMQTKEERLI
jgi:histidyl-tRNA synthetase